MIIRHKKSPELRESKASDIDKKLSENGDSVKPNHTVKWGRIKGRWPFRSYAPVELPLRIRKGGFRFTQEIRTRYFAVYRKIDAVEEGKNSNSWEVIAVQVNNRDNFRPSGNVIPKGTESYPKSKQWGEDGWTYQTREAALEKFLSLRSDKYSTRTESGPKKPSEPTLEHSRACMFPEMGIKGIWRLQTSAPEIVERMKRRCRQAGSWRQVGWSMNDISPDIFAKHFQSRRDAERAFKKIVK